MITDVLKDRLKNTGFIVKDDGIYLTFFNEISRIMEIEQFENEINVTWHCSRKITNNYNLDEKDEKDIVSQIIQNLRRSLKEIEV